MKRVISAFITVIILLCSATPFAYAEKEERFTVTNNEHTASTEFATREMAIASFIRAVGMEKFKTNDTVLNGFSDKTKISYTYIDEMSAAVFSGLVSGYEDKTLKPRSPITRAEALVIVNRALSHTDLPAHYYTTFTDTPAWAEKQINRLAAAGIVKGYGDGTVGAYDYLTYEQVTSLCDRIIRFTGPCGDFYDYVNSRWLADTTPDGDIRSYSETDRLSNNINNTLSDIIFSLYRRHYNDGEEFEQGSDEMKIIDVYSAIANQGYRDSLGFSPIDYYLKAIDGTDNTDELLAVMTELEKSGFTTLLPVTLSTDLYDSSKFIPYFSPCYTGITRDLITGEDAKENLSAYKDYVSALFELSGDTPSAADTNAELVTTMCYSLLKAIDGTDNTDNISASFTVYDMSDLRSLYSNINIKKYLAGFGFENIKSATIYDKKLAKEINSSFKPQNLSTIKLFLKASVLDASALYLTSETFAAYIDFQDKLTGTVSDLIPSDYAVYIIQEFLGWELGKMYIDLYFPETAKPAIENMTGKIITEYVKIINNSLSLSPPERTAIVTKLKNIKINVAYPEDISSYKNDIEIKPISEGGNLMEYKILYSRDYSDYCTSLIKTNAKANRGNWMIYPQTANAMYDPTTNSITVPAGILAPPFYDQSAEYEENLGGIGTVIAHEISHAFDTVGVQFDENGNLIPRKSAQNFISLSTINRKIIEEYSKIPISGEYINGKQTLNENFADIAGMTCVISLAGADNPKLDLLFSSYAKAWRAKTTQEYDKLMLKTDVHSPASVRVNRVLSNFTEFQNCYGIIEGDGMFIPDAGRITIWK